MSNYDDIINLAHPEPKNHKRMSRIARAAQFGAFRALTGHEEAVAETARLTEREIVPDENLVQKLNERLSLILEHIDENFCVTITYFEPDELKDGGSYINYVGYVKKIDLYKKLVITDDGTPIKIDSISDIQGEIFDKFDLYF